MYGKILMGFFDSSINESDPITRLVFIGMIVLSDQAGRIDVTSEALARRLNLPHDQVEHAIAALSAADPRSRSMAEEGRRIVPMDPARAWGWVVVNKESYRDTPVRGAEEIRRQNRERKARQRKKEDSSGTTSESKTNTYTGSVTERDGHAPSVTRCDTKVVRDWFEEAWRLYPVKDGKESAWKHYRSTVKNETDRANLLKHLENYKAQLAANPDRYVKNGSTWFHKWTDEIYATGPAAAAPRERRFVS